MAKREITKRTSGQPYYRAVGSSIEQLNHAGEYEPYAVIDPRREAMGTSHEVARAVAEVLDLMDLNRDARRYTAEARLFHLATGAPGFRRVHSEEL